ncbi:hypothetical protein F4777DRAFT_215524 [Nemania sp. FL0916]|nr:hypothetical protein F4777DRAFT_215524 [Nemania sp. FL0916]
MDRIPRKPERPYMSSLKSSSTGIRRRPLRTYSTRTACTAPAEPAAKRRCSGASSPTTIQPHDRSVTAQTPEQSTSNPIAQSSPLLSTKKGTITAYFGRRMPQPPTLPFSDPLSDALSNCRTPSTTPPSSPPSSSRKRRARRLKTRVATQAREDSESSGDDQENQDAKDQTKLLHGVNSTERVQPATSALSRAKSSVLHQADDISTTITAGSRSQDEQRREHRPASIQTTLSLSMTNTQYVECKECGMVYNQLHKTDVRYHARRHASLRRKAKTLTSEEDE